MSSKRIELGARGRRFLLLLGVAAVVLYPRRLPLPAPVPAIALEIPPPAMGPVTELESRLEAAIRSALSPPGRDIEVWGSEAAWDAAEASLAARIGRASPATRRALLGGLIDSRRPVPVRCLLARLLSRLEDPAALAFLERTVEEAPAGPLTWEAAVALANHPDRAPGPRLRRLAGRLRGWGRQYAFVGLRRLRDPDSQEVAREALGDHEPAVVRHAAGYLIERGDPEDVARVDRLARDHFDLETRGILGQMLAGGAPRP